MNKRKKNKEEKFIIGGEVYLMHELLSEILFRLEFYSKIEIKKYNKNYPNL